ncbi:hypothetical protein OIE71_34445 [Streptomyces sp. NBC_01725]|uniref:hypothetical protein n=1 Tax=Streptomyces sp. NBC_01725 TaxID=2975923 RepID=UPI002E2CA452|nr:hypothetical protein [Streptomyces sp. NBC_01725]
MITDVHGIPLAVVLTGGNRNYQIPLPDEAVPVDQEQVTAILPSVPTPNAAILLMANVGVINATGDAAPDTWRRLTAHMLRSYAAPDAPLPDLPGAPAPTALYRAMVRLTRTRPA